MTQFESLAPTSPLDSHGLFCHTTVHEALKQEAPHRPEPPGGGDCQAVHRRTGTTGPVAHIRVPSTDRAERWPKGRESESRKTLETASFRNWEKSCPHSLETSGKVSGNGKVAPRFGNT